MLLRPRLDDFKVIGFHIGRLIVALGLVMIIPLITGILFLEYAMALNFGIALFAGLAIGLVLQIICSTRKDLNWMHGLVVAATAWLAAMFIGAIPLYLSGQFGSFLDACFDSMSGFATTGLSILQGKDHISISLNMWRHLMMFLGGQGIVVIGLTFLIKGTAGAYRMYVGEAREEKVLPNVIQTARFIWLISIVYLVIGTFMLTVVAFFEGIPLLESFLNGLWIFMAAFDTGGFTPYSQSILYYHSFPFELVTMALMILGTLNFGLHYALWDRKWKELRTNIETKTLLFSVLIIFTLTAIGLTRMDTYPNWLALFRKGFYQILSAHSGTGYMTIYAQQFVFEWKTIAMFGAMLAMAIGGSACSTAGGIKVLRVGIFIKALFQDVKRVMSPGTAVISAKFHHIKDIIMTEKFVRTTLLIILAYLITYFLGTVAGIIYGYPLEQAAFESVSAAANVGLSCGITSPAMPAGLKVVFILQMWLGRLEFMSIFALIGFFIATFRGKG
ncbi:MAG: TrkH family potassium uptake protein [Candidatus Margulisbacteria bacterium]|nr:TrkH family potassium uptake protein [Candidatus Margulisiibacteriota bacterium]MBU1021553.1 TrkH family potassium uptake protein [Candidatus Margulisiibacteriota bacterium]MBU1728704.1 TrkH family potassium uptake protein [Candidatus Margulisiibacteriota bacterium]MBU1955155.1 TrkH family potassium uptake protein [Candidatus Margulisiibacteriota bacterium]